MDILGTLYYLINTQLDQGNQIPIDEAADLMIDGEITSFARQYDDMDRLDQWDNAQLGFIDDLFAANCIYDPDRLGIQNDGNGFALIAANIVRVMLDHEYTDPNPSGKITPKRLELTKNW